MIDAAHPHTSPWQHWHVRQKPCKQPTPQALSDIIEVLSLKCICLIEIFLHR